MIRPGSSLLHFVVGEKIGAGTFGEVYNAKDKTTGEIVAIKCESHRSRKRYLEHEYKILAALQSSLMFPRCGIFGTTPEFRFYSMELLGPSITQIFKKIPIESGVIVMQESLKALEQLHIRGFVHRDIKPGNIITRNKRDTPICIIDFGLTRQYINTETGKHIEHATNAGFRGSKAYASINCHAFCSCSRKDDMISWFYVMIEMLCGKLPWRGVQDHEELIYLKSQFNVKKFTHNAGPELADIWTSINYLHFDEKPNYKYIYEKIDEMKKRLGLTGNEHHIWETYFENMPNPDDFVEWNGEIEGATAVEISPEFINDDEPLDTVVEEVSCNIV